MNNNNENSALNKTAVRSSLWVNANDRTPNENLWFICYAGGVRQPLKFNKKYQHWYAITGRTYKLNEIERWLDA
jgi:hypothetical protein